MQALNSPATKKVVYLHSSQCFPNVLYFVLFLFFKLLLSLGIHSRTIVREKLESRITLLWDGKWIFESWPVVESNEVRVKVPVRVLSVIAKLFCLGLKKLPFVIHSMVAQKNTR